MREGGLGLRDPLVEAAPSRLAALLKATSLALELGAHPDYVDHETAHTKQALHAALAAQPLVYNVNDKYLQRSLTSLVQQKHKARLYQASGVEARIRMDSLCSPHTMAWVAGPSPFLPCGHCKCGRRCDGLWEYPSEPTHIVAVIEELLPMPTGRSPYEGSPHGLQSPGQHFRVLWHLRPDRADNSARPLDRPRPAAGRPSTDRCFSRVSTMSGANQCARGSHRAFTGQRPIGSYGCCCPS